MRNDERTEDDTQRKRGVAILNTDTGKLADVNNGYAAIFGQEQNELIGTKPEYIAEVESELVIPVYDAIHGRTRGLYELLEDEDNGEYIFYRDIEQPESGKSLFVEFTVEQLAFNGDQFVLITAITPETDAPYYNTLERFRYRLDAMMFDNRLGWWNFDVETGDATFHENKLKMIGVSPGDVQTVEEYIQTLSGDSRETVRDAVEALSSGEIEKIEVTYPVELRNGETRWLREIGAVTQYTQEMNPLTVTGLTVDITAEKEAEKSNHDLIGKMSVLTQLLTQDVRNDLLDGRDYFEASDINDERLQRGIDVINHAIMSIGDVQDVIKRMAEGEIDNLPTQPVSIEKSLERELERLAVADNEVVPEVEITGISDDIYTEASLLLGSVLHNVFIDAMRVTESSPLYVDISEDGEVVKIGFHYPLDRSVDDDGNIIDYPDEEHVEERRFGLYMSREIIQGYGGELSVSKEDSEKHITIELPFADP
jgi:PAS domain-containing protein